MDLAAGGCARSNRGWSGTRRVIRLCGDNADHGQAWRKYLAPILQTTVPYQRLLLFNQEKLPKHPVAALHYVNSSGLVLERGPVTVLEDGAYHGEAIVPFTKKDTEVYMAIAAELGISVQVQTRTTTETTGIRIAGSLF